MPVRNRAIQPVHEEIVAYPVLTTTLRDAVTQKLLDPTPPMLSAQVTIHSTGSLAVTSRSMQIVDAYVGMIRTLVQW